MLSPPFIRFVKYLLTLNAAWHGAATYYFIAKPKGILRKYTNTPLPVPQIAADTLRFLGSINAGYVLLALLALNRSTKENKIHASDLWVLSLANLSQFICDIVAHVNGHAKKTLLQITIPDGTFALLDGCCAYLVWKYSK